MMRADLSGNSAPGSSGPSRKLDRQLGQQVLEQSVLALVQTLAGAAPKKRALLAINIEGVVGFVGHRHSVFSLSP